MKILVLGDIHGRDHWKRIVNLEFNNVDRFVFIGDYFDSFFISVNEQYQNWLDILEFKKNNDVILLCGNHDIHYFNGFDERYSGFNPVLDMRLELDINDFQICYQENNFLFSHAGISAKWLDYQKINNIEGINELFKYRFSPFKFRCVDNLRLTEADLYGNNTWQSPLWIRPDSLDKVRLDGYRHVVGHTNVPNVVVSDSIVLVDCIERQYIIVDTETNIIEVKNTPE